MSIRHLFVPRTRHGAVLAAVQTGLASIAVPAVTGPSDEPDTPRQHQAARATEPASELVGVLATLPVVFAAITLASALTPAGGAAPSWPDAEPPEGFADDPDTSPGAQNE